jgi:hypothetical protein
MAPRSESERAAEQRRQKLEQVREQLRRRRTYLGRGERRRLAELERIAKSPADRLRRQRAERAAAYTGGFEGVGADPPGSMLTATAWVASEVPAGGGDTG